MNLVTNSKDNLVEDITHCKVDEGFIKAAFDASIELNELRAENKQLKQVLAELKLWNC